MYFTKVHQNAIVEFVNSTDYNERNRLYREIICPAISELVDKIAYTYKFTSLPNNEVLRDECKTWLITILEKFDPEKGSTAFSYFSVVTKNWFIHRVKEVAKEKKRSINYEEYFAEESNETAFSVNGYEENREKREFWEWFGEELRDWDDESLKERERKVLAAIKVVFSSVDEIEVFNKKAIYMYLREITGLTTKQIAIDLATIRKLYKSFRRDWNNGQI